MSEQREWFEIDYSKSYTRDNHRGEAVEFDGFLIPAPSELLSRAEWEASIDYEAALNELISRDYHRAAGVTMYGLKAVIDAALDIKEDS